MKADVFCLQRDTDDPVYAHCLIYLGPNRVIETRIGEKTGVS